MYKEKNKHIAWEKWAAMFICIAACTVILYLTLKYLLIYLLPIIFALLISMLIVPLGKKIASKLNISDKFCSVVIMLLLLALTVFLVVILVNRFLYESGKLLSKLSDDESEISKAIYSIVDWFGNIGTKIPFLNKLKESGNLDTAGIDIEGMLLTMVNNTVNKIGNQVPVAAGKILTSLPSIFLFIMVLLISCFYFCADYDRISKSMTDLLPYKFTEKLPQIKNRAAITALKYVKAYFLILLITAAELYIGLLILGIDYAFMFAVLIAVVDLLPVFGVGTVLVPWGCFELILKNYYVGFGLIIIYATVTLLRQLIEPKIIGKSLGIHPLAALTAIYVGFKAFGFIGLILGPFTATVISVIFKYYLEQRNSSLGLNDSQPKSKSAQ